MAEEASSTWGGRGTIILRLGMLWGVLIVSFHVAGIFDRLDAPWVDYLQRSEPALTKQSKSIALVAIDRIPADRPWPWPRLDYALLLRGLTPFAPDSVVFDVLLHDRDSRQGAYDSSFADLVERLDPVIFSGAVLQAGDDTPAPKNLTRLNVVGNVNNLTPYNSGLWPTETFSASSKIGVNNLPSDPDAKLRRLPLIFRWRDAVLPSLSLQAAAVMLGADWKQSSVVLGEFIDLRNAKGKLLRRIPIDFSGFVRLRFRPSVSWINLSFDNFVLYANQFERGEVTDFNLRELRRHQIWVGCTDTQIISPLSTALGMKSPAQIHMAAAQMIVDGTFIKTPPVFLSSALFLTFSLSVCGLFVVWRLRHLLVLLIAVLLCYCDAARLAFAGEGLLFPLTAFVLLLLGIVAAGVVGSQWEDKAVFNGNG